MSMFGKASGITQEQLDKAAVACEDYAHANVYTGGLRGGGETYCGWPLNDLVDTTFPNADPALRSLIASRIGSKYPLYMGNLGGLGSGGGGGGSYFPPTYPPPNSAPRLPSNHEMLMMRMRWSNFGEGFEHVDVHMAGDTVHIWVITKDNQSKVFEDGAALFPSDALVTKLNMIKRD